jgi:outer membrane receptor protein involved in Fe transport
VEAEHPIHGKGNGKEIGMSTKRCSPWRAGPLLLLAALASPAFGQAVTATVTGKVADNSGGAIGGASVVATNQETGVQYPARSNEVGAYTISGLPLGRYVVRAELAGFKAISTNPFTLESGQTARINLKLEVGAVSEVVEVVGVSPILQTESAVVGEVISGTTVAALPLNGRNFAQLALLIPGVQTHAPDTFTSVKTGAVSGRPYVNGQREQSNNFMLDGIDQNEAVDNLIAYYPSPDAIAEMRVETNNYSAEFGNVAGGVVAAITKSGTNEFHGSLFEFMRDDRFDANSWSNNRSGAEKGDFEQHIFGGTLGGPVARNKVFFFLNYQGTRVDRPVAFGATDARPATVALDAWRRGDFSGVAAPIIDPLTGRPFPGNQIPASRFSPAARALLADQSNYPLPNRPGLTGNFVADQASETRNHQGDVKIDANLSAADNLSIRGSVGRYRTETTLTAFPLIPGGGNTSDAESLAVNWSHMFSGTTVNELRVGYSHVTIDDNPGSNDFGVGDYNARLGIPGGQLLPGLSSITFGNAGIDGIGNAAIRHFTNNKTFQLSEKLSLSRGRHFLSVGGQALHYRMGQDYASNSGLLGTFAFNQNYTGHGFADFLLGLVGQKTIGRSGPWEQRQNRLGLFVQDDFKVNSRLTLNLGLRWEYASPISEKDDRQRNFDLDTGEWVQPGQGDTGRGLTKAYYGGFSPRVGFAWTANDKTVFRGGYGMVQYMEGTGANCRLPLNPPFFGEFNRIFATPGTLATGFDDVNDQTNLQIRAWDPDMKPQLTQQWNVFVERQVTGTTSINVGYVGSRSTRVVTFGNANQPLPGTGPPSTWVPDEQRRPFPQFGLIRFTAADGKINYNALQASLRRRRANGLEFLASYTFSNSLTDNGGFYGPGWGHQADQGVAGIGGDGNLNIRNKELDYGPAWFSARHTGALSGSYELPIGTGRAVGGSWSGVKQALLGGWNVSSILTVRSGLPVTVVTGWGNQSLQSSNFVIQERADRVQGVDTMATNPSWDGWLNPAAFTIPALGEFGDSGVGSARGPGFYNIDLGFDKIFELGGTRQLTFRIEAFNLLNHANKGLPVRDFTSGQFGQILTTANAARVVEFAAKLRFD